MGKRISSLYFQTYRLALDLAHATQDAYRFEREKMDATPIIVGDYWDSLKMGLLNGETLMLGLDQLEKAYMDDNEHDLEIEKTISLTQLKLNGQLDKDKMIAEQLFDRTRKCVFNLNEELFDAGFSGRYCRKIKSVAITIPVVLGPYENLGATLTRTNNRMLVNPHIDGVKFLRDAKNTGGNQYVRSGYMKREQIAISKGVNDIGLFELNFRDERYFHFEGTRAISDWELTISPSSKRYDSISDVIIHLRYTAKDGGENFRQAVEGLSQKRAN